MTRNDLLKDLIKTAVEEINKGTQIVLEYHVSIFKSHDIIANMHLGRGDEMNTDTEESELLRLEWYMGCLVDICEARKLSAVNSWLNLSQKILEDTDAKT